MKCDFAKAAHSCAERMRMARRSQGISQEELAEHSNLSVQTISRLECGQSVSGTTYFCVTNALGMQIVLSSKIVDV